MHFDLRAAVLARAAAILLIAGAACATPAQRGQDTTASGEPAPVDDRVLLARLEQEARALVQTNGCETATSCRTAPVGWRGCGGPREYVVYCPASTDSVALFRKLDDLKRAEMAYNAKAGMMSTCEMRLPPTESAQGGSCRAAR